MIYKPNAIGKAITQEIKITSTPNIVPRDIPAININLISAPPKLSL